MNNKHQIYLPPQVEVVDLKTEQFICVSSNFDNMILEENEEE